jgi:amidase
MTAVSRYGGPKKSLRSMPSALSTISFALQYRHTELRLRWGEAVNQGLREMPIVGPSTTELAQIAADLGFHFDTADVQAFREMMRGALDAYATLDRLPDALPEPRYARLPGTVPAAEDNPFGAFARITEIPGAPNGPLSGKRIAVKDCVCVAGVPMMNGSSTFEGYVPEIDATVVARMLDAGGTIVGKAANEDYCFSGGSHTNARGPVDNPYRAGFTAGGSSSGSGALVGGGIVDMAIGTDQGGSVRIPASCCGVVGMKATFGLVPCTGNLGMEYSLDHVGPLTRTVADNALLLEVIAGPDGLDSRQSACKVDRYTADLGAGAKGLRIGILDETFGLPQSDARTDAAVRQAVTAFSKLGAEIDVVNVPLHRFGGAIWMPRAAEGCLATMFHGNGFGFGPNGVYLPSAMQRQSMWRHQSNQLADTVKLGMLVGEYMSRAYGGRYYGRAQNLARLLAASYDEALTRVDILASPTVPFPTPRRPAANATREEAVNTAFGMTINTAAFNVTGHPSMSMPCGWIDGLPVGLMLTGRRFEERLLYRAASALEAELTREGITSAETRERTLPAEAAARAA